MHPPPPQSPHTHTYKRLLTCEGSAAAGAAGGGSWAAASSSISMSTSWWGAGGAYSNNTQVLTVGTGTACRSL
jgi:hypothetical protein